MTTLHRLEIFATVAKHQSVSKAAEANFISQPGISTQLKLLEREYGVKLYTRTSRGILLTQEGMNLLGEVQAIFSRIENLPTKLNRNAAVPRIDRLTVGGSPSSSSLFLPRVLAEFKRSRPKAQVVLRTSTNQRIEEMVVSSLADIALITRPPSTSKLIAERYEHGRLVAFTSPAFLSPRKRGLTLGDLSSIPLVMRNVAREGRSQTLMKWCEKLGVKLNIAMLCDSPDAVKTAVRAGVGVGILFEEFVKTECRKGIFKIVRIEGVDLTTSSFIVYRKDQPVSSSARCFRAILRARLRQKAMNAAGRRGRQKPFPSMVG